MLSWGAPSTQPQKQQRQGERESKKKTKKDYLTLFIQEEIKSMGGMPSPERIKELERTAALLAGEAADGEAAKDADGNEIIL